MNQFFSGKNGYRVIPFTSKRESICDWRSAATGIENPQAASISEQMRRRQCPMQKKLVKWCRLQWEQRKVPQQQNDPPIH